MLISEFDLWQPGYAGASVAVYQAGTTTLSSIYSDEALSIAAANPQTLASLTSNGVSYGKFAVPLYVGTAYSLVINSTNETGVHRAPITTLDAEGASLATVVAAGGSVANELEDIVARLIHATDYGVLLPTSNPASSSSTNSQTISNAIGAASSNGGGVVVIPDGTYAYTSLSIPAGVHLQGQHRRSTILQSILASATITLADDTAGIEALTIDGVGKSAGSIGLHIRGRAETYISGVRIKNFETGLKCQGSHRAAWTEFYIDNCTIGAKLHGDIDASDSGAGTDFTNNKWEGGLVTNCTEIGVELKYVNLTCWHNGINNVGFEDNTGTALKVFGARWTNLDGTWFSGNTTDLEMLDGTDTTLADENTVIGFRMWGGMISSDMSFTGKCQDVVFDEVHFDDGTYTLTTVLNAIITKDCIESAAVALDGNDATQWMRCRTSLGDFPGGTGLTADAVATEAWSYDLAPGERIWMEAKVIANGVNVIDYGIYFVAQGAHRPGSTLAYDNQTANFTLGSVLTGATSGATGTITADADAGATGTLTLRSISGEFVDDETITDASGGTALANGVLSHQAAALLGSITALAAAVETDAAWACIFGVTAYKARLLVTGAASKTVEWSPSVQVTSG